MGEKMASDAGKFQFRLVLLGSNRTGKTSILNRFLFKKFEPKYKPTVEDLFSQQFGLGSIEIKVDFLDTSGSMQFPAMRHLSISTGNAFLIVYSVDDDSSFEAIKLSIAEIQELRPDYQEIPIVFAGNKCDLPRSERKVEKETVSNYVYYELPRLRTKVIECSCKENINIDNIFKAYLSLAKVSLSSAVSANLHKKHVPYVSDSFSDNDIGANSSKINSANNDDNSKTRSSSVKPALRIRKSCDASISITSKLRNLSLTSTLQAVDNNNGQSGETLATMMEGQPAVKTRQLSDEVFIKDALEQTNKLAVEQKPKPRSRSLIWRPHRKTSRGSNESSTNDCRVT